MPRLPGKLEHIRLPAVAAAVNTCNGREVCKAMRLNLCSGMSTEVHRWHRGLTSLALIQPIVKLILF